MVVYVYGPEYLGGWGRGILFGPKNSVTERNPIRKKREGGIRLRMMVPAYNLSIQDAILMAASGREGELAGVQRA